MRYFIGAIGLVLVFSAYTARADILFYPLGGAGSLVTLQGKVTVGSGRTVTLRHSQFGMLYFDYDQVKFFHTPATLDIAQKKLRGANNNAEACLDAARWALHHGLLTEFNKAAAEAWRVDKNNPAVKRLANLKRRMNAAPPIDKELEAHMLKFLPIKRDMKFIRSKHYLLLHNMPDKKPGAKKFRGKEPPSPAQERLDLLEMVYESYLLKFYLEGLEVEVPKKRLMVILFRDREDFEAFSKASEGDHSKAAGLYNKKSNIAVFHDQSTMKYFKDQDVMVKELEETAQKAVNYRSASAKDIMRAAKTLKLVIEVAKQNQDIEVVTHEATHQMAANTNLMPNEAATPIWAAEGMATYFESPKEAAWAGIGTVNDSRLKSYRAMAGDSEHSSVEFVASDKVFMMAGSHEAKLAAYGQSWAFTHFLMARHFDKLMKYYKLLAKRRHKEGGFVLFQPDENLAVFKEAFGDDLGSLNTEWRSYMSELKTDVEQVIAGG